MKNKELYNIIRFTPSEKAGKDVDYAIVVKNKTVFLVFRGTNSVTDIIADIDFPTKLYKTQQGNFLVHKGFCNVWKTANDSILSEFIEIVKSYPEYKAMIIGHSLGGAMATLAAEDYYFRTGMKVDIVTFGCPRFLFGNKSKEHFLNCVNSVFNYEINNDIVPKIPAIYCNLNPVKVGEDFDFIKMISRMEHYHCQYGIIDY